jgi:hypothetical protein
MKTSACVCLLVLLTPAVAGAAGAPDSLRRAAPAALPWRGTLASTLGASAARAAGDGPEWVGWAVPLQPGSRDVCCFDGATGRPGTQPGSRGCRLDRDGGGLNISSSADGRTGEDAVLHVFLQPAPGGGVEQLRVVSASCPLDAGGHRVAWLEQVSASESVSLLAALAGRPSGQGRGGQAAADAAVMALALHRGPEADQALVGLARTGPAERRQDVWFWLGQSRGQLGFETLRTLLGEVPGEQRKELTFALSQSPVPAAGATLTQLARRDPAPEVRSQALFWLAQTDAPGVVDSLREAMRRDASTEVREQAVFAVSQLPDARATTELLAVLHDRGYDAEVRQQALFWLGQSDDPRAIAALEKVLLAN